MPAPNTAAETADHAEELRALSARLEELETRAARPGAAARGGTGTPEEAERRAIATFARTGDLAELRTVSTDSDPDGGYLVLPFLEAGVRTIARDRSPMRTLASAVTVDTDAYEIIVDPSEAGAVWVTERGARPETSTPELKKIRIPVGELYASPKTTQRTLDDARIDVAAWLTSQVGNKFAIAEGAAFVTGSGLDGRPKGILSYPTADTADFVRDWGVLQHVTSSTDDPTSLDFVTALIELSMSLRTPYRSNAAWLMSRSVLTSLRKITDENGAMLFSNDGRIVSGEPDRLLGFPIYMDEGMPAASPGNLPIAFGDFSQGYTIVDRFGMRTTVDAVTQKGFVLFDTYKRVGGGVVDFNAIKLLRIAP